MNLRITATLLLLLLLATVRAQSVDAAILKTILSNYYKSEKVVVKGRTQFLFLYCEKVNNNEEMLETVNAMELPTGTAAKIKKQIMTDLKAENWNTDLELVYAVDKSNLNSKINSCLSVEEYQVEYKKRNANNQRLMIISKPILYDTNRAIVKVVFYRTIEHNNGSVLHLEKINNEWVIKEFLNPWST